MTFKNFIKMNDRKNKIIDNFKLLIKKVSKTITIKFCGYLERKLQNDKR